MKAKLLFLASLFLIFGNLHSQSLDSSLTVIYVGQYKDLAIKMKDKYNIPASLLLAQAIYITRGGTNHLATHAKNHFGNTCTPSDVDNRYHQDNNLKNLCFRKYNSPEESYEDYMQMLKNKSMYNPLFLLPKTDYRNWVIKLKEIKHSSRSDYAELILGIIEKYNLAQYDFVNYGETPVKIVEVKEKVKEKEEEKEMKDIEEIEYMEPPFQILEPQKEIETISIPPSSFQHETPKLETPKPEIGKTFIMEPHKLKRTFSTFTKRQTYEYNGVKLILAQKEDTYKKIADEMQLAEKVIRTYNDVYDNTVEPIEGEVVYIQPKNKKTSEKTHTIVKGESLRYIAQKYTVQLKLILKINTYNLYDIGPGTVLLLPSKNQ